MVPEPPGSDFSPLAHQIATEARAADAGRVAFQRDGKFFFATPETSSVARVLEEEAPRKFKFQARSDERWVDTSRYWPVDAGSQIVAALRTGDLKRLSTEPPEVVARAASIDPEVFAVAVRNLHRHLFDELNRDPSSEKIARAHDFLERQSALHSNPHVAYLRSTVSLYDVMVRSGLQNVLRGGKIADLASELLAHIDANPTRFSELGARIAAENVLGKVHSLEDRSAAAQHFTRVRELDEQGLTEHFYLETGGKTYFSHREAEAGSPSGSEEIRRSIVPIDAGVPANAIGILIAMDPGFYRTYAPMLRFYAQQMPEVEYTFLLCGSESDSASAVADGDEFSRALNRLNRSGKTSNVHHFRIPVPSSTVEPVTFYACARFFAVQMMLERYSNAYLMDADLAADVDPRPYLRRVSEIPFGVPSMAGFSALYPWRRYLAGNVAMDRRVLESSVVSDLQNYLAHGLQQPHSWTLDQNALTYAIERSPDYYTDLRTYVRPFYQPKFRLAWERRHRELTGE